MLLTRGAPEGGQGSHAVTCQFLRKKNQMKKETVTFSFTFLNEELGV